MEQSIIYFCQRSTVNGQRSTIGALAGLLGTLILVYNPWTISFKSNVLSDIPFTLFFLLTTAVYLLWKKNRSLVIIGLLAGFAILIRTIGIVLIIAIALDKLIVTLSILRKGHTDKITMWKELKEGLIISTTALGFVALLSYFVFPVPSENNYASIISSAEGFDYLTGNLRHYYKSTAAYLTLDSHSLVTEVLAWVFGGLALLGIVGSKREEVFLLLLILGVYGIAVLFPYQQGFRYVYPAIPLIIYFFFDGVKKLFRHPKWQIVFLSFFFLVTLSVYISPVLRIHREAISPAIISGPQSVESLEAFQYVKDHVPSDARLVFHKPRVLSLYTDRACMGSSYKAPDALHRTFIEKKIDFIVFHKWMDAPGTSLEQYVQKFSESHLDSLWANPRYVLYKFNPVGKE